MEKANIFTVTYIFDNDRKVASHTHVVLTDEVIARYTINKLREIIREIEMSIESSEEA